MVEVTSVMLDPQVRAPARIANEGIAKVAPATAAAAITARVVGYDVARALAICSMMLDHCSQALGPRATAGWGMRVLEFLDGRASATFIVLAGVGVTLLGRRKTPTELRRTLLRRGALLLVIGLFNQAIWAGDVLRVFGVSMMFAGLIIGLRPRALLGACALLLLSFPVLMQFINYDSHWNWETMRYAGLWTRTGMFRNVFYDGFRPVIPWAGLLVFGMWLGRLDVSRPRVRWMMVGIGIGLTITVEVGSKLMLPLLLKHPGPIAELTLRDWLDVGSMPPMPPFMLSVTGTALVMIGGALIVGARFADARPVRALVSTGQMTLTWYLSHILLGAVVVHFMGWHRASSMAYALFAGASLFVVAVIGSTLWKQRWRIGPMEWVLRSVG
jgi:uncharacterized protein